MWFLLSCIKPSLPETSVNVSAAISPSLSTELLAPEQPLLEEHHRRPWPPQKWDTAKVYAFNHEVGANGKTESYLWTSEQGWSDGIHTELELTRADAELSVELIHRGGGTFVLTKCPIVPRHGIVYFSQGEPVASWSLCFECGDALTWPAYHESRTEESERYRWTEEHDGEVVFLFDQLQTVLLDKWQVYFNAAGTPVSAANPAE